MTRCSLIPLVAAFSFLLATGIADAQTACCPDGGPCDAPKKTFLGPTDEAVRQGHVVPAGGKLDRRWIESLTAKGERKVYRGEELFTIGMPCGGIGAGQLYVRGDGTLAKWWIFNNAKNERHCSGYQTYRPRSPIQQGFALCVKEPDGTSHTALLSQEDFDAIEFIGEYPIAEIRYLRKEKPQLPVAVSMEAFSPWIPLNAKDSATPATVLRLTLKNTSDRPVDAALGGWLQNGVCLDATNISGRRHNTIVREDGLTAVRMGLAPQQSDSPTTDAFPTDHPAMGNMAIVALDSKATACAAWESKDAFLDDLADDGRLKEDSEEQRYPLATARCAAIATTATLEPGQSVTRTFLVTWFFPNRPRGDRTEATGPGYGPILGNMYANWYDDSVDVARYVAHNFERLDRETHLFREAYFDTTLPYWLVHRIGMPLANLATGTFEWWKNGHAYGWEGVMCCRGTCTHVWHYEQATGRLFPELARSMRVMGNLPAMDPQTGAVRFRGEGTRFPYAADGQAGVILMFYRQHLMSTDGAFLRRHWPAIKKMIDCMIRRDGEDGATDGIVNTSDHTTYDINFVGANTHCGSMYLAALQACERMARLQGEDDLAANYERIRKSGAKLAVKKQFNGDYFVQLLTKDGPTKWQIGDGCLTSQLLGNGWTDQVNLAPVYPEPVVQKTLASIFRYNWTPDVGPYYELHKPEMIFVDPGEPGLLICTYPLGSRLDHPLRYRNTIMQGYDYDVANQMLSRGMLVPGLAIYRANHDNYDGTNHNPWNEQQCGDHYARAMAAWGALISLSGFVYDGPAGMIGFAPNYRPDDFKAFFTSAEGWGSLVQQRTDGRQTNRIELKWGRLTVKTLVLQLPAVKKLTDAEVTVNGRQCEADVEQDGTRVTLTLGHPVTVARNGNLQASLKW